MTQTALYKIAIALLGLTGLLGGAAAQSPATHQHSFSGAEQWAHVFDDPNRDAWQKPHEVIQALALKPDAVIADIGAGTGYFAVRFANMVPQGRVYGVDIEPDMVKYLAERAKREKRDNVVAIAGAPDDPKLPEKADLILMVDVFHHIDDRARYFRSLRASLKPGGRIAVIDFRLDSPEGPPKAARIAPERVIAELKGAGYTLATQHRFLPKQYFLVFQPEAAVPTQPGGTGPGMMMHGMGDAAFADDMQLVHAMLFDNQKIRRSVVNLPDGIRTVTESEDEAVARAIKAHVASMEKRLYEGRVFNLFSPTLPVLFDNKDKIKTVVEMTGKGSIVTQTSGDAVVVAALQAHAVEVSELARDGMAAMMRNMRANMMGSAAPR